MIESRVWALLLNKPCVVYVGGVVLALVNNISMRGSSSFLHTPLNTMTIKDNEVLRFPDGMPSIQLGEFDPALTMTPPPPPFPENTTADHRAAMRFRVSGNAVCMVSPRRSSTLAN